MNETQEVIDESNYVEAEIKEEGKIVVKKILWFSEASRFLTVEHEIQ